MGRAEVLAFAPGRANLIGEHTDYNDGVSLPFAIDRGTRVRGRRVPGETITVHAGERPPAVLPAGVPGTARLGDWRDFPRGVVGELGLADIELPGAELHVESDVPEGAGLSSSAALSVSLTLALLALAGRDHTDLLWLARLCSRVENEWVGANTGLMDQLTSLYGRAGCALRIDFRTVAVEPVRFALGDWRLVVLDSGERHRLTEGGYGERRAECERARAILGLDSLRDATAADLGRLAPPLDRRVRHVIEENERVEECIAALERGDLERVGELLSLAHASERDLFEVSTDAVERTVGRLLAAGAAGARLMGGGFGGAVIALLPPGVEPPPGAIEVAPAEGARLL
jgi:galactokinase